MLLLFVCLWRLFLTQCKDSIPGVTGLRPLTRPRSVVSVLSIRGCLIASVTRTHRHSLCVAAPANPVSTLSLLPIEPCVPALDQRTFLEPHDPHSRSPWSRFKELHVPRVTKAMGQRACRYSSNARSGNTFRGTTRAGPSATTRRVGIVHV